MNFNEGRGFSSKEDIEGFGKRGFFGRFNSACHVTQLGCFSPPSRLLTQPRDKNQFSHSSLCYCDGLSLRSLNHAPTGTMWQKAIEECHGRFSHRIHRVTNDLLRGKPSACIRSSLPHAFAKITFTITSAIEWTVTTPDGFIGTSSTHHVILAKGLHQQPLCLLVCFLYHEVETCLLHLDGDPKRNIAAGLMTQGRAGEHASGANRHGPWAYGCIASGQVAPLISFWVAENTRPNEYVHSNP